ncbi:DNA repair protein rhp54 [Elysia marginata]|uniref:DNA repair protein rhp54 n=1 Tax=Elysia marginata TaxID=1093978 RepID=A0AAV4JYI5_9GAST|nr:DNA repair protein rhp54 [Elysia marginata]
MDSEWSDSELMSLGLKMKASIRSTVPQRITFRFLHLERKETIRNYILRRKFSHLIATPDPSQEQTQEHEAHLKRKETARDYKASIKGKATGDPTIVASCFDLQKVLPCPHDNCAGQNRNTFVAAMFWFCMKTMPVVAKIEHRFLEVGHTQNENDSVHSVIAQAANRIPVYTPGQWATVARGPRRNKRPYAVKEMTAQDFFHFKAISKEIKNLDNDEDGEKSEMDKNTGYNLQLV